MQELKDKNLVDDTFAGSPEIIEIPLSDLCKNIDFKGLRGDIDVETSTCVDDVSDWPPNWQNEWLLSKDDDKVTPSITDSSSRQSLALEQSSSYISDDQKSDSHSSMVLESLLIADNSGDATQRCERSPTRVQFADSLPNGHLSCGDIASLANIDVSSNCVKDKSMKRKSSFCEETYNLLSSVPNKEAIPPLKNNMVKSLIRKRPSLHTNEETSFTSFSVDTITKEELLVMWRKSEIELNKKLDLALREKKKLQDKIAQVEIKKPI